MEFQEQIEFTADDIIPGQLLAVKEPPAIGEKGFTVTGTELPPSLGEDIPLIAGKNTFLSNDRLKLYASSFGRLTWKGNRADVDQIKEIDTDLSENINFDGIVQINGKVDSKKITATGDVIISGGVDNSEINSGSSISIGRSINKGKITAQDNIKALSAKESTLVAKGMIILEDGGLFQSNVQGYSVICKGKKGVIAGGTVIAKKEINASLVGSERSSIQTEIKIDHGGKVAVSGTLYPKVKMALGRRTMVAKKAVKNFTMKVESSNVSTVEYEEPTLEIKESHYTEVNETINWEKYPPSVVVSAFSVEEAKRNGAALLGFPHTEVEYKILKKDGSTAKWLRVFGKGTLGPWDYEKWDNLYGTPVDGSFSFENHTDGIFITIVHHRSKGKEVTPEDIITECRKEEFVDIDIEKIKEACAKRITIPVKIGPRQFFKGTIEVIIPQDESAAFIKIIPPKWGGMLITLSDVLSALSEKNVIVGINEDKIKEILQNSEFNIPVKVAEHELPVHGPPARLIYQCGLVEEQELIHSNALPGQILAVKSSLEYGRPGKTVTGKILPPLLGIDLELIPGKNTFISQDKRYLFSLSKGKIFWTKNRVDVEPTLEIKGSPEENIEFEGTVHIVGDLKEKIKIGASGNVFIKGNVHDAEIDSGENITIDGKISMAKISAGRNIKASSGKDSTIESINNIILSEEGLINCTVTGQRVICLGSKGMIIGGTISAKKEINAKSIGSDRASIQTFIKIDQGGKVAVSGKLYQKVSMILGRRSMTVKKELKCVTLKAESGGIANVAYEEPDMETQNIIDIASTCSGEKPKDFFAPPSIIVVARSEDEAKQKGAKLLEIPYQNAECITMSNLFRVYSSGVTGPWEEEKWEELYGPPQDGNFELINQQDGLFLKLTPCLRGGKFLETKEIFTKIKDLGYSGIDSSKVIEACEKNKKGKFRIGIMQFTKDFGGLIKIEISKDETTVHLTIIPPTTGDVLIQTNNVLSALEEKGVTAKIKEEEITNALKNRLYNQPILIAEATHPLPGKKASFTFRFGEEKE